MPHTESRYTFDDMTVGREVDYEDVNTYRIDPQLGRDLSVVVLVKWDNQRFQDDKLRQLAKTGHDVAGGHSLATGPKSRSHYYRGYVVTTTLDLDYISDETTDLQTTVQASGGDRRADGLYGYACGNRIVLTEDGRLDHPLREIANPMFARLHSLAFSPDGTRMLTSSASLDMVYELSVSDGRINWSLDPWEEMGLNVNKLGQSFYRHQPPEIDALRNPASLDLIGIPALRGAHCVVDDPDAYGGLGLATALTPVFINSVDYESDEHILATSFSRGEAWRLNRRTGIVQVVAKGMGRPHGLHLTQAGDKYLVSDTLAERVRFIDRDFAREQVFDFSHISEYRKPGLEHHGWLQYTTQLGSSLYCAVMCSRQTLTLFDVRAKTRRDIPVDPDWGVQMVIPM